jgi:hypothetical protein
LLFNKVPEGTTYLRGHYCFVEESEAEKYLKSKEAVLYDHKNGKREHTGDRPEGVRKSK